MKQQILAEIRLGRSKISVQPFIFKLVNDELKLISERDTSSQDEQYLRNCYAVNIRRSLLIRSGRVDTDFKFQCLLRLVAHLRNSDDPLKLACCQLDQTEANWQAIAKQNRQFHLANPEPLPYETFVHLNTPFPHFFHHPEDQRIIEPLKQRLTQLPRQINMEALAQYCAWVYFSIKDVYDKFLLDAADEYTLEARIVDFKNEVLSLFLKEKVLRMKELFQLMGEKESLTDSETFEIEKELVLLREGIKKTLQVRYHLLDKIVEQIRTTQGAHPDLRPIGEQCLLLQMLLGSEASIETFKPRSWISQLILLHLLNKRLGVISVVNCEEGGHQTNYGFAASLAAASLDEEFQSGEFIELMTNWDDRTASFNKKLAKQVLSPQLAEEEPLIVRFRHRVYTILKQFTIGAGDFPIEKGMIQDPELLNLLPSSLKTKGGQRERLVHYDPETGSPIKLSLTADRTLAPILL